jgi:hypothetical protein
MSKLKAQTDQIFVENLGDECVIYQSGTKKAHSLNPTATWIWRHCDGTTDVDQMVLKFQQEFPCEDAANLVASGIRQLQSANLLITEDGTPDSSPVVHSGPAMTRRSMVGVSSALMPVIASILVPTAAAAKSKGYDDPVHGKNGDSGNNGNNGNNGNGNNGNGH